MDYLIQAGARVLKATNFDSSDDAKKKLVDIISKFEGEYNTVLVTDAAKHVNQIMQEYGQAALDKIDQIKELGQKMVSSS